MSAILQPPTAWGGIPGTLSNQTDLDTALTAKLVKASNLSDVGNAGTSLSNLGGMSAGVYDPRNAGKISGATDGGGVGGILSMKGGTGNAGSITTSTDGSGNGGSINTSTGSNIGSGGSIITSSTSGGNGGTINTGTDGPQAGGSILTYAVGSVPGGSINTSVGGGSIDTAGTGSIELGVVATRTTVTGTATQARSISFPDANGTVALTSQLGVQISAEAGWATPASAGNKATVLTNYDTAGLAAAAALVGLGDTNTQVGELTDVLQALITKLRSAGILTT